MPKPLCIDLFCGLGGWTEGFLAEGWDVVGFDIERHVYGDHKYPAQLVLQDVLTIHGSQFRNADCIVASPPCQRYSWLAMPWSRSKSEHSQAAKALRREWETNGPDNRLFDACFRIQREAIEATRQKCHKCNGTGTYGCWQDGQPGLDWCPRCDARGIEERYIPLVVENVCGAQEWVGLEGPCQHIPMEERWRRGRSAWNHGSFHLWGDVPALMPINLKCVKVSGLNWSNYGKPGYKAKAFNTTAEHRMREGQKTAGGSWFRERNGVPQPGIRHEERGVKVASLDGGRRTDIGKGARFTSRDCGIEGTKIGGDWFSDPNSTCRKHGSRSKARKAASAQIAKIPLPLSQHIARVYYPRDRERVA